MARLSIGRSLRHFWRTNLAVLAGAGVATSVLAGALLVGESVQSSLRNLILDRLGAVEAALVAETMVRAELAEELAAELGDARMVPLLALRGSAVHGESGARASQVGIYGVDDAFGGLFDAPEGSLDFSRRPGQLFPSVLVNERLAEELGVEAGDPVVLSFRRQSEIPEETLIGREETLDTVESLRLSVAAVLPDDGPGGFSLAAQQGAPLNAFVDLRRLARSLDRRGQVNALLAAPAPDGAPWGREGGLNAERLAEALRITARTEDLGVTLRSGAGDAIVVESRKLVLEEPLVDAVRELAGEWGSPVQPVLTYLANTIRIGDRELPYSTVGALDPPTDPALGAFRLADGGQPPRLGPEEILLNDWAARELDAQLGDAVEVVYFELGAQDELRETSRTFRLAGIVALEGLAADPALTPELPGMSDADDMAAWDPPFPVDLDRILERDETYWDEYRSAPKAFVGEAAGRVLWASRYGDLTSLRLAPPSGLDGAGLGRRLEAALPERLDPGAVSLSFLPVRELALEASQGSTDFASLFLAFSQFLIVSAALLVGLLFRLGVEQRAREVGLLRAAGFPLRRVRRRFLAEGTVLAGLGAALGLGGAVAYAGLMLHGLRTWWLPAIGEPILELQVSPTTLAAGWVLSVAVVLVTVVLALRRLGKVPVPLLLSGSTEVPAVAGKAPVARWVLRGALVAGLFSLGASAFGGASSPALAFGTGASLLVAGLAAFSIWCARAGARRRASGFPARPLAAMGARNSARSAGRSVLSVALVATACFMIVAVAANRGGRAEAVEERSSGAGGFALVAESEVPILQDLDRADRRLELGFSDEESTLFEAVDVVPFRLRPGEDASCLNLFRPQRPRILGVTPEMVERGGFSFRGVGDGPEPWTLLDQDLGPGVVPALADYNSATWILKLGVGDDFVIEDERGEELRLRLVGLFETGLFQSELLISETAFTRYFPSRSGYSYFLVDAPADRAEQVREVLEARLGRLGLDAEPTEQRLEAFHAVQNTYLATFQTLGGLGLILGTLGLAVVLLRNVLDRRGELATLRAFGFRRRRLQAMVLAENAFLLLLGMLLGTIAALVAVAPHLLESANRVPWASLALTLGVILAVGLTASVLTAGAVARVPLLPSLKED